MKLLLALFLWIGPALLFSANSTPANNPIDSITSALKRTDLTPGEEMQLWKQLGEAHEDNHDAPRAADAYGNAIRLYKKHSDTGEVAALLFKYASMVSYTGDYYNALVALEEVLSLVEQKPDKELQARTLMQLGVVNFFQQKWDDALYFYQQALTAAEKLKNRRGVSIAYNNIANVYQKKNEGSRALSYYQKALTIQRKEKDSASMCNCLMNMGTIYMQLQQPNNVMAPLQEALTVAKSIGDQEIEALTYMNLAQAHAAENSFTEASLMLHQAQAIAEKGGYRQVLHEILNTGSHVYRQAGDFKNAYHYLVQAGSLGDSLESQQIREKTKELEVRYKTAEKETQLEIHQRDLRFARIKQIFMMVVVAMLLALTGYLIYSTRMRRRHNRKLVALNATKDKLFSIISHDLKAPVIAQKIAAEALMENLDSFDKEGIRSQIEAFHTASEAQSELLQNLLKWAQLQTGRLKYTPVYFDISEVLKDAEELYRVQARNKEIRVLTEIPPEQVVFADKQMISTVIRNLLNNAIKFSHPGGIVHMRAVAGNEGTIISVSDEGTGMTSQQISNLFESGTVRTFEGTKGEKGSGLGLIVSHDLLKRNESSLNIESDPGKGTIISFSLKNTNERQEGEM